MAAAGASAVSTGPTIDVTAVNIDPVTAPIDAPLSLCIDFSSSDSIPGAHWQIKFMVDMTNARHIIDILETPAADISEGANKVAVDVPAIDFGLLKDKPSTLANAGLLLAVLFKVEKAVRIVGNAFATVRL